MAKNMVKMDDAFSKHVAKYVSENSLAKAAAKYGISEADAYGAFYKHNNAQSHVKASAPKTSVWQKIVSAYDAIDKATDRVLDAMDETFGGSAINRATVDVRKSAAQTAYVVKETAKDVSAGIIGDAQETSANLVDLVRRSYGTPATLAVTGDGRLYMTATPQGNAPQPGQGPKPTGNTANVPKHPSQPAQHTSTHDAPKPVPRQAPAPPEKTKAEMDLDSAFDKIEQGSQIVIPGPKAETSPEAVLDQEVVKLQAEQLQKVAAERDAYKKSLDESEKRYTTLDSKFSTFKNEVDTSLKQQAQKNREIEQRLAEARPWYKQWAAVATIAGAALVSYVVGDIVGASGREDAVRKTEARVAKQTNDAVEARYRPVVATLETDVKAARSDAQKLGFEVATLRGKADEADMARQEAEKRTDSALTELNAVKSTVKKASEDYAAAEKRAAEVAAEANKLKQSLNSVLQNATIAQSTATDAEKKLKAMTSNYEAMTKKHEQMAAQYNALAKVAETIKGNETAYTAKLSDAEKRVAAVANEKRTLESELAKLRSDYATLQAQKAAAAAKIDQMVVEAVAKADQKGSLIDRWNGKQDAKTSGPVIPVIAAYSTKPVPSSDFIGEVAQGLGMSRTQFEAYQGQAVASTKTPITHVVTPNGTVLQVTAPRIKDIIDGATTENRTDTAYPVELVRKAEAEAAARVKKIADAQDAKKLAEKQAEQQREAGKKQAAAAKKQREQQEKAEREAAKKQAEHAKRDAEAAKKAAEDARKLADKQAEEARKQQEKVAREAAEAAKKATSVAKPAANTAQSESYKTQGGLHVTHVANEHVPDLMPYFGEAQESRDAGLNAHIAKMDKIYGTFDHKNATDAQLYERLQKEATYWQSAVKFGAEKIAGASQRAQFEAMHYLTKELAHTLGINGRIIQGDQIAKSQADLDKLALLYLHDKSGAAIADGKAAAPSFTSMDEKVSVSQLAQMPPLEMLAALSNATPSQAVAMEKDLKGKDLRRVKEFIREARYLDGRLQKDTEKMRDKKMEFEHMLHDYIGTQLIPGMLPRNIDFSLIWCPPQPGTPAQNRVGDRLGDIVTTATLFQQKYAPVKGEEKLNKRGVPTLLTDWAIGARNDAYLKAKANGFNVTLRELLYLHWAPYASKTVLAGADTANGASYKLSDTMTDLMHDQPHDENEVNRLFLGHYGRERGIVQSAAYMRVLKDGEWRGMMAILNEARKAVQTYFIVKAAGGFGNGGGSHNGGGIGGGQNGGGGIGGGGSGLGGGQGGGGGIFGPGSDSKKASDRDRKQFAKATKRSRYDEQQAARKALGTSSAYDWVMAHAAKPQPKKTAKIGGNSFTIDESA